MTDLYFCREQEGRITSLQSEKEYVFSTFFTNVIMTMCFPLQDKRMFYFAFRRLAESTDTLKKENAIIKSELGEWNGSSYIVQSVFTVVQSVFFFLCEA